MPLTYAAPIYFTPIPAAGKHIHTKLLKMRWNQDFKGKDFGYQIGLSNRLSNRLMEHKPKRALFQRGALLFWLQEKESENK